MRLPLLQGTIRRRLLVNYRIHPDVMATQLPEPFRPKLHCGWAVAGVCLMRLERLRPRSLRLPVGFASEHATHRVAVCWDDPRGHREGAFVHRRDTDSWFDHLAGGRILPGEHRRARFDVHDDGLEISIEMESLDDRAKVRVAGRAVTGLPSTSIFSSAAEASDFFERGALDYALSREPGRLDGVLIRTDHWAVQPLAVREAFSTVFADESRFPPGSVVFDHALVMRDLQHEWHLAPALDGDRVPV